MRRGCGAPFDACIDAWRYLKPDDPGYTYDGIANVCGRPGIRLRPVRIFCNAELRGAIRGATLAGASKYARTRSMSGRATEALFYTPSLISGSL